MALRYRMLLGAIPQGQLTTIIRLTCVDEEIARLPEITEAWRLASRRMAELSQAEVGAADQVVIRDLSANALLRANEIAQDPLFQSSFADFPNRFAIVEIDRLVAPQRDVNLDYVSAIARTIPGANPDDLIDFCLGPRAAAPELNALQNAQTQMTFSSRSLDLRFLGGYPKNITEDDIRVAHAGGQPVAVITLLIGFGATPVNVFQVNNRLVLANGFHRTFALRAAGVQHMPVVIRQVANADVEFPEQLLGLSKTYLLGHPRPVLVKDFFDAGLTTELRLKPRRKMLKVAWGTEEGVIPE